MTLLPGRPFLWFRSEQVWMLWNRSSFSWFFFFFSMWITRHSNNICWQGFPSPMNYMGVSTVNQLIVHGAFISGLCSVLACFSLYQHHTVLSTSIKNKSGNQVVYNFIFLLQNLHFPIWFRRNLTISSKIYWKCDWDGIESIQLFYKNSWKGSLVVWWLRLCASTAGSNFPSLVGGLDSAAQARAKKNITGNWHLNAMEFSH